MIALWTLARAFVWVLFACCYLMAGHFRRRHQRAEEIATDPGEGWCELEKLEARRDERRLARSLKRWEESRDGWQAAQGWFGAARSRRLAYFCGALDAWLLWGLERSGVFDCWEAVCGLVAALEDLGTGA